jgi:hypothetical protein
VKIMTIADVDRLRGDADPGTHLARYDHANSAPARAGVKTVIDVWCPACEALAGEPCHSVQN